MANRIQNSKKREDLLRQLDQMRARLKETESFSESQKLQQEISELVDKISNETREVFQNWKKEAKENE